MMCKIHSPRWCLISFKTGHAAIFPPVIPVRVIDVTDWRADTLLGEQIGHSGRRVMTRECARAYT